MRKDKLKIESICIYPRINFYAKKIALHQAKKLMIAIFLLVNK